MPDEHLGQDLRLLEDTQHQQWRQRGSDLDVHVTATGHVDLDTVTGAPNLAQALLLRMLTPLGELADLGHPDYGSRLHELIGEPNTLANRNRAKVLVLQTLAGEPRVARVVSLVVRPSRRDEIVIDAVLEAARTGTQVNLVVPISVDGGQV